MNRTFVHLLVLAALTFSTSCGDDDTVSDAGTQGDAGGSAVCGNGKVEGDELCDKSDLDGESCSSLGDGLYTGGTLKCTSKCTFNVSMCIGSDSGIADMDGGEGGTGG